MALARHAQGSSCYVEESVVGWLAQRCREGHLCAEGAACYANRIDEASDQRVELKSGAFEFGKCWSAQAFSRAQKQRTGDAVLRLCNSVRSNQSPMRLAKMEDLLFLLPSPEYEPCLLSAPLNLLS
jgi:hypothetical protein